jgi:hypothetical protein
MLNRVDDVIKEDLFNIENPFFDQALYQIMMLRYPELNMRGTSFPQHHPPPFIAFLLFVAVLNFDTKPSRLAYEVLSELAQLWEGRDAGFRAQETEIQDHV